MAKGRKPAARRGRIVQAGAAFSWRGNLSAIAKRKRPRLTELNDDIGGNPPGRPNSISLIREEAQRQLAVGKTPRTLKEFANELSQWLRRQHRHEPAMVPRVVERNIRDLWRSRQR
jgi:hypothetical protein